MHSQGFKSFMGGFLSVAFFSPFLLLVLSFGFMYIRMKLDKVVEVASVITSTQMEQLTSVPVIVSPTATPSQGIALVVIVDDANQAVFGQVVIEQYTSPIEVVVEGGGEQVVENPIVVFEPTQTPTITQYNFLSTEVPIGTAVVFVPGPISPEPTFSPELTEYLLSTTFDEIWDIMHSDMGRAILIRKGIDPAEIDRPCLGDEKFAVTMEMADDIAGKQVVGRQYTEIYMEASVISGVFHLVGIEFPTTGRIRVLESVVKEKLVELGFSRQLKLCVDANGDPVAYGEGMKAFADWLVAEHYIP